MTLASNKERGYGLQHQRERAKWATIVEAGEGRCVFCHIPLDPKGDWDLDHTEDRTGWRGPAHVKCNRAAGARNATTARMANQNTTTREW